MTPLNQSVPTVLQSIGLLILRVGAGGLLMAGHGWTKLAGFSEMSAKFAGPFGLSPTATLALAVFAEFFCSLLVIFGLLTRLAAIPVIATMAVAAGMIHAADPWFLGGPGGAKEPALLYLIPFVTLFLTGPGRFSLDALLWSRRKPDAPPAK